MIPKGERKPYFLAKDKLRVDKFKQWQGNEPINGIPPGYFEYYDGNLAKDALNWAASIVFRATLFDALGRKILQKPFPHEKSLIDNAK